MEDKKFNRKNWITSTLRRASYRWPPRNEALKKARVDRGLYQCAVCQECFSQKDIKIDHIQPVVSLKEGFTTWDDFMERLFCDVEGFQILCDPCHDAKTAIEDTLRANYNKERKAEEKRLQKIAKQNAKEQERLDKQKKL